MATSSADLPDLLSSVLDIPATEIADGVAMNDVETWDSLKHMELISTIEDHYGIELTFEEILDMTSVSGIRHVLDKREIST
jgi:acyl carrier protein